MTDYWVAIDRFGLVFTKFIFGLNKIVPVVSNILMLIVLGGSAFFFDFCVKEWVGDRKTYQWFYYIFPASYISAPCLAEQFYFTLQSFEVAWAGLLCMIAVYCIGRKVIFKESVLWVLAGIVFMVWPFGSYQAFVALFIAVTIVSFIMCYQNLEIKFQKGKEWFLCGIRYTIIFGIGLILYKLTAKTIQIIYQVESTYVDNMFVWNTEGIKVALNNIKGDICRIYLAEWDVFFSNWFLPILFLCVMLLLFRGRSVQREGYYIYIIAIGLFAVSPLLLTIISGSYQPIRGQFVYVFVTAYCLAELTAFQKKKLQRWPVLLFRFWRFIKGRLWHNFIILFI